MKDLGKLFEFATKAGSLEGYVYKRDTADPLDKWVGNIERMYRELPDDVRMQIKEQFKGVLDRTLTRSGKGLDSNNRARLTRLMASL